MTKRQDELLVSDLDQAESLLHNIDLAEPLDALAVLGDVEQFVTSALRQLVSRARRDGATWQQVANVLGLNSRQAAEARYGG